MKQNYRTALAAALLLTAGAATNAGAAPAAPEMAPETDAVSSPAPSQEPAYASWISLAMLAAAGFVLWRTMRRDKRNAAPMIGDAADPLADSSFEARLARRLDELNADAEPVRPPPGSFGRRKH